MTQEEKAEAYDKVREKIKVRFGTNVAEEIFSEFEESEDERIRKITINLLKQSTYETCMYEGVKMKDIYAWLEKQGEQKPEWSEEDEKIYQSIMDDTVQENQLDRKQIDWLRDIKSRNFSRPQKQWKPSKEQMNSLRGVINSLPHQQVLFTLYNDLKKLKGE